MSDNNKNNNKEEKLERIHVQPDPSNLEIPFEDEQEGNGQVFIECPGATIYDPETREIISGIKFIDEQDVTKGYEIIDKQVFAPGHRRRRLVKKENVGLIRRCQACQDLTVRMIRNEGADFCIPNPRFPRRKQLKSVDKTW